MSNKKVGTFESVVKSDSSVEQRVYLERSRASIKGRLFDDSIGFRRGSTGSTVYFVMRGGLLRGGPTLANLGNDHGFISKEYISIEACWRNPKQSQESLCSIWAISYHFGGSWFIIT